MENVANVPEWFGAAILGAIVAAIGYIAKLSIEGLFQWQHLRAAKLRSLLELASLLHASRQVFIYQRKLVDRLQEMLTARAADSHVGARLGFEHLFAQAFENFNPEEAELHAIIRSMTQHSLRLLISAES